MVSIGVVAGVGILAAVVVEVMIVVVVARLQAV